MRPAKQRWRIEVAQFSEERIPTRWQRFWGDRGNWGAWVAEFWREDDDQCYDHWDRRYGYTREDALAKAEARIEEVKSGALAYECRKEVLYVK